MTDPVLIVGAGPTGLTAALELSRLGIPVRLIDKRDGPATTSRAIGIQARTLELLAQRGLSDEMVRLGNKGFGGSVYGGGKRVFRLDFGHIESRFNCMLFLSQAETERVLREGAAAQGAVPEWSTELVGIAQDPHSHAASPVTAVLAHKDGSLERIAAPWVISAEGAHSVIRTTLDVPFDGKTLVEQFALGDLRADAKLTDRDFHIFSSEHGFMGLFPMGGGHFRLIAGNPMGDPERGSPPTLEEFQAIYDQRSPVPAVFHDLTWSSWFRINSRMVSRLKVGRLLFGGDAAHIHSPAGAQGMNTGIQDMINLSWKLAMVQKGEATEALLDTYEADRLPVMRNVLSQTEGLTSMIGTENPLARTLFNHLAPWIASTSLVQDSSTARMAQVALDYRGGPLVSNHFHAGALKAGIRVPDITVRHWQDESWHEALLHTLLDPSRFVLLDIQGDGTERTDPVLAGEIAELNGPISLLTLAAPFGAATQVFRQELGESSMYLVRPDGYVAVAAGRSGGRQAISDFVRKWLTAPKEARQ